MRQTLRLSFRLALIPALAALSLALPSAPAPAKETSFVIPRDEGYGVAECMTAGASCARTVADAWCAAMGRGPSVSYGFQDVGGAVERVSTGARQPEFRVTCG